MWLLMFHSYPQGLKSAWATCSLTLWGFPKKLSQGPAGELTP